MPNLTIAPFERSRHLEPASMLLADRHRRDRERDERFPAAYEVPAACTPIIEQSLDTHDSWGVVALRGGDVVGFLVATPTLIAQTHFLASFFPPRQVGVNYGAHAAEAGLEYDVYREMYGAIAERAVSLGFFDHSINLPARDAAAQDALVSLGFGRTMCAAIRGVDPPAKPPSSAVQLHQASAEDATVIFELGEELTLHHARTPIFNPYIRESDAASHEMQRGLLSEADTNAHWVAYEDGRAVGMNTFMPPGFLSPLTVPDKTIYLYQGIVAPDSRAGGVGSVILAKGVEWARERGYDHIALHFATANLSGARFWQANGFAPVEFGMRRRIDERIAWANK